jgi:hypothetical protein
MLREMAATKDKLAGHVLGGMRSVRAKRIEAEEREARGVACVCMRGARTRARVAIRSSLHAFACARAHVS